MELVCTWQEKMAFTATCRQHSVPMDAKAPFGTDRAATPKELLLASICGCSGIDVISLLRKARQLPDEFTIDAHADTTQGQPSVFKAVHIVYKVRGALQPEVVLDAVHQSMTLYCGVSAMVVKACPITYDVQLNDVVVGCGAADFSAGQ